PRDVILARAAEMDAPVRLMGRDFSYTLSGPPEALEFSFETPLVKLGPTPLGLVGRFQGHNAAIAVTLALDLVPRYPKITAKAIETGLSEVCWPCRMERVLDDPPVFIDVAHNPMGAKKLAAELEPGYVVVVGCSKDKDVPGIVEGLAPIAKTFVVTRFEGERAMTVERLAEIVGSYPHCQTPNLTEGLARAFEIAGGKDPILVTGSVFTSGEARRILIERYGARPLRF
ncbi:MAG: dihydrofolate synthase / folylpolyglutamate synthase, partial [Candidatus Hydrogenedentes bacterium]|nr:dihydrofolate synthase / folylpolyglutamate synthase [Candidatus Hydrogenedentota bacterium]